MEGGDYEMIYCRQVLFNRTCAACQRQANITMTVTEGKNINRVLNTESISIKTCRGPNMSQN